MIWLNRDKELAQETLDVIVQWLRSHGEHLAVRALQAGLEAAKDSSMTDMPLTHLLTRFPQTMLGKRIRPYQVDAICEAALACNDWGHDDLFWLNCHLGTRRIARGDDAAAMALLGGITDKSLRNTLAFRFGADLHKFGRHTMAEQILAELSVKEQDQARTLAFCRLETDFDTTGQCILDCMSSDERRQLTLHSKCEQYREYGELPRFLRYALTRFHRRTAGAVIYMSAYR